MHKVGLFFLGFYAIRTCPDIEKLDELVREDLIVYKLLIATVAFSRLKGGSQPAC